MKILIKTSFIKTQVTGRVTTIPFSCWAGGISQLRWRSAALYLIIRWTGENSFQQFTILIAVLCTLVAWLRSDTTLADRAPMHYNVSDLVLEYSNDLQFSYRWGHETNNMDSKLSRSVCWGPESCDEHLYMASVIVVVIVCCWCFCSCCCFWTSKSPCTYPSQLECHTFSDYHHSLAKRHLQRGEGWHCLGHWEP